MKDRLDDFMSGREAEFDDLTPSSAVWDTIAAQSGHKKQNGKTLFLRIGSMAAAVIVTFFVAYQALVPSQEERLLSAVEKELMETENFYNTVINSKKNEIFQLTGNQPELHSEINGDLAELDSVLQELKNDLKDNIANTEVVEAMIQNYRMKVEILEDILMYLNKDNEPEKKTSSYEI